jgi:hypothetical protein
MTAATDRAPGKEHKTFELFVGDDWLINIDCVNPDGVTPMNLTGAAIEWKLINVATSQVVRVFSGPIPEHHVDRARGAQLFAREAQRHRRSHSVGGDRPHLSARLPRPRSRADRGDAVRPRKGFRSGAN